MALGRLGEALCRARRHVPAAVVLSPLLSAPSHSEVPRGHTAWWVRLPKEAFPAFIVQLGARVRKRGSQE